MKFQRSWMQAWSTTAYWGPVRGIEPLRQQVHQIYPGVDWRNTEHLLCNLGIGFGLTPVGNQLVVKSRLEYEWG